MLLFYIGFKYLKVQLEPELKLELVQWKLLQSWPSSLVVRLPSLPSFLCFLCLCGGDVCVFCVSRHLPQ